MPTLAHCGLYFTPDHVKAALKDRERDPLKVAWAALDSPAAHPWDQALLNGFRWRFGADPVAGEAAVRALTGSPAVQAAAPVEETLVHLLLLAQLAELVRDHSAFNPALWDEWAGGYAAGVESVLGADSAPVVDARLRLALLSLVSGIVLEHEAWFEQGAEGFRQAIREDVRPAGYLESAISEKDGGTFQRQFRATGALVLMAEAAGSIGVDLWGYESRGISVSTAATYLIYYYYYPEKWKWEPLPPETSQPLYQQEGGFLEMLYRRNRHKDMKLMLDDLRPVFDRSGGGLTTLSHAVGVRRGLFG
jgi:hypothetical protein